MRVSQVNARTTARPKLTTIQAEDDPVATPANAAVNRAPVVTEKRAHPGVRSSMHR